MREPKKTIFKATVYWDNQKEKTSILRGTYVFEKQPAAKGVYHFVEGGKEQYGNSDLRLEQEQRLIAATEKSISLVK